MGIRGEIFSTKVALDNRTYFFNVKENRMGDLYLNIVESKNRDAGGFERQSIILFAEDSRDFLAGFDESLRVMEKAGRDKRKGRGQESTRDAGFGEKPERRPRSDDSEGSDDSKDSVNFNRDDDKRDDFNRDEDSGGRRDNFKRDGFKSEGFKRESFSREGFNRGNSGRDSFKRNGFKRDGFKREGFKREGFSREGFSRGDSGRDGFKRENFNREGFPRPFKKREDGKSSYSRRDDNKRDGYKRDGFNRDDAKREGSQFIKPRKRVVRKKEF
ncbi:MAG: DUF3276 family protein [Treponema sp.]|nr:DUF3276 family protein [Treponema sp.]